MLSLFIVDSDGITTAILIIAWSPINDVIPAASKLPNISGAFIAIIIPLQINTANKKITARHPINPNSSAKTANIKSLWGSDMYKYFCLLSPKSYSKKSSWANCV